MRNFCVPILLLISSFWLVSCGAMHEQLNDTLDSTEPVIESDFQPLSLEEELSEALANDSLTNFEIQSWPNYQSSPNYTIATLFVSMNCSVSPNYDVSPNNNESPSGSVTECEITKYVIVDYRYVKKVLKKPDYVSLYRYNVSTGERTRIYKNKKNFRKWKYVRKKRKWKTVGAKVPTIIDEDPPEYGMYRYLYRASKWTGRRWKASKFLSQPIDLESGESHSH
jgi:hypothetical protein